MNQDFVDFCNLNYRKNKNGELRNSRNVAVPAQDIMQEYALYAFQNGKSMEGVTPENVLLLMNSFKEQAAAANKKDKKAARPSYASIVQQYFEAHPGLWIISHGWDEIQYTPCGNGECPRGSGLDQLTDFIYIWALDDMGWGIEKGPLRTQLNCIATTALAVRVKEIFNTIGYDASEVALCDSTIDEIHDLLKIKESKELFRTMLKHWVWLVKRKMRGWSVTWEVWINLYGAHGTGKSTLVRAFCSFISEFFTTTDLSIFADATREREKFTGLYVLNFDELSCGEQIICLDDGSIPKDVQRELKKFITQDKGMFRNLGGQTQDVRRLTFNCISSANDHLYDVVFDDKTMRRFFEFNCTKDKSECNQEYYKVKEDLQSRFIHIWKGVDEYNKMGYIYPDHPLWDEVQRIQESYYPTNTNTRRWIDDTHVVAGGESDALDMYHDYVDWCKERCYKPRRKDKWEKDIHHYIPESETHNRNINIEYAPCV